MEKRFKALRTIAGIFKIIAWIMLVGAIIAFFVTLLAKSPIYMSFLWLVIGIIYFLSLYAFAELIHLFLSLEENVRLITSKVTREEKQQSTGETVA